MYPFTRDIHCSVKLNALHWCSLFGHCYMAIHLISGLRLSISRCRSCIYMVQYISIQIAIHIIFPHVNGVQVSLDAYKRYKMLYFKICLLACSWCARLPTCFVWCLSLFSSWCRLWSSCCRWRSSSSLTCCLPPSKRSPRRSVWWTQQTKSSWSNCIDYCD